MGHPGAPNHDHHRSIWFAHHKVQGVDFWSDQTSSVVRQKEWLAYQDGDDEAVMAVKLFWLDGHDPKPMIEQELFIAIRPTENGETILELQSRFTPTAQSLEFQQTNFGFLAVRVAKSISTFFGNGIMTNSEGQINEPAIFGKQARWVDYSGSQTGFEEEGITFFDHPSNLGHPSFWHVREDGWMGASTCMASARATTKANPLVLRFALHAHRGRYDPKIAFGVFSEFTKRKPFELVKAPAKHTTWGVRRI